MTVLRIVFQVTDPELLAAAALHDTIEDTKTDRDELAERFGDRVAQYAALLSKDKREKEEQRERNYFAGLAGAQTGVKLCKLADVYDNLNDSLDLDSSTRGKKIEQARELLGLFHDDLSGDWSHVLECLQQQVDRAAAR